ncbi:Alpha/beta hydrolase family-domain-containing protein [Halenospora varia]|nr:Alpha/beta hydrolase family-domain-containing protein [Halenospora varia]
MTSISRFQVIEHTLNCSHLRESRRSTKPGHEGELKLAIKQYIPLSNPQPSDGDITIIAAHGNGLPKETYEPLWEEILARSKDQGFTIRGIWIADISNQGASGVLNENIQGDDTPWFDHSRDLFLMIDKFRDQMTRPIFGIGHSMGCGSLIHLSIMHPTLFTSLTIIEPIIMGDFPPGPNAAMMSTYRPDLWPTRTEAENSFKKNKFFASWDSRALNSFLKHALREVPTALYPLSEKVKEGSVTLTTTKHQEAWSFIRSNFSPISPSQKIGEIELETLLAPDIEPEYRKYTFLCPPAKIQLAYLPFLRPSVLYIYGQRSHLSLPNLQKERMKVTGTSIGGSGGAKEGRVEQVVVKGAAHMVPCEKVGECADAITGWLGRGVRQFEAEEEFWKGYDAGRSEMGGMVVSKQWIKGVRGPGNVVRPIKGKL